MCRKIHLLIVDDDPVTREMMDAFFMEKGYFVFLAKNGEEALHLLGEEQIDLVITDYRMPEMDGRELVGRMNNICPLIPVILITGLLVSGGEDALFLKHFYDFFIKPVDLRLLEMSIAKALGESSMSEWEQETEKSPC